MEAASYGIMITEAALDVPGPVIIFANETMAALTGYRIGELVGATPRLLQGPETDAALLASLREALAAGRSFSGEAVNYRKDGSPYRVEWIIDPVLGSGGQVEAWISVQRDVTRRHENRVARHRSEERLRAIFDEASVGLAEIDVDGRFLRVNRELCRIMGRDETELLSLTVRDVTFADDLVATFAAVGEALRGRHAVGLDKCYVRPGGALVWAHSSIAPLVDVEGEVRLLVVTSDLTRRRAAEAALRESEEMFRQFGGATEDVLWIRDATGLAFEYASPAFERIYGLPARRVVGRNRIKGWAELIVPEDRSVSLDAIRRACGGEHVSWEYRIIRRSDGALRWIRDTAFPIREETGRIIRVGGISEDATDARETSERLAVLVAELQHRTRNLLGVVRSISQRSIAASSSLADYDARFGDRLNALSRVNGLLSRLEYGHRITFDELIRAELAALGSGDIDHSDKIDIYGPSGIRLRSATVQTFALALHELATNAVKHGALSQAAGRLRVHWRLDTVGEMAGILCVEWEEKGVALPRPYHERTPGYGRELIERALPYQLGARTSFEMREDGIFCTIAVPVSKGG